MVLFSLSTKVGPQPCSSDCDFVKSKCLDMLPNAKAQKNVLETFMYRSIFRHVHEV